MSPQREPSKPSEPSPAVPVRTRTGVRAALYRGRHRAPSGYAGLVAGVALRVIEDRPEPPPDPRHVV